MKKFTVILIFVMLTCITSLVVYGQQDTVVTVGNYLFTDSEGNRITAVNGPGICKVSTQITSTAEAEVAIIAALYQDGKIVDVEQDNRLIDGDASFEVSLSIPAGVKNASVAVYVWENIYTMRKLAEETVFPSSNAKIQYIDVYGEKYPLPEDGSLQTEMILAPSVKDDFFVNVKTADKGASVSVEYPPSLPGDIVVLCTSSGGIVKEYTIACERRGAKITNLVPKTGNINLYKIGEKLEVNALAFGDRTFYYTDIHENLLGSPYILTSYNDRGSGGNPPAFDGNVTDYITFDIDKSAQVYFMHYQNATPPASWLTSENGWAEVALTMKYWNTNDSREDSFKKFWVKEFIVQPGETVNVNIGATGNNQFMGIVVKWIE